MTVKEVDRAGRALRQLVAGERLPDDPIDNQLQEILLDLLIGAARNLAVLAGR